MVGRPLVDVVEVVAKVGMAFLGTAQLSRLLLFLALPPRHPPGGGGEC